MDDDNKKSRFMTDLVILFIKGLIFVCVTAFIVSTIVCTISGTCDKCKCDCGCTTVTTKNRWNE
jgi:hypothetical protein